MSTMISWTNETWNPVTGCSKVSDGCRNCYAETLSRRFGWTPKPWTAPNAIDNVKTHEARLRKPYTWKQPVRVFVNSMSDLFHELVPDEFIAQVFAVMADTPQHTYQILTKRPERAATWPGPWPANIWMGASVEDGRVLHRIDALRDCRAQTRFISGEPLIGPWGNADLTGIHWVIVGGESGRHLRSPEHPRWMQQAWARQIRDLCLESGAAYFYKQDSGPRTEMRPWLIHEDGTAWVWKQFPGALTPPTQIDPNTAVAADVRASVQLTVLPQQPSLLAV